MDEFDFIEKYLAPLAGEAGLSLKDDAAVYSPPKGHDIVLTKDAMVEGVHFPNGDYGARTAQKLLRVNLSDLAAKAATPIGYLLSLSIPHSVHENDLEDFAAGLKAVQGEFGLELFGGDTVKTPGPMVVSATLIGTVISGEMVKRSGAKPGDDIYVTGTIGDAYLGLQCVLDEFTADKSAENHWAKAYYEPKPRLSIRECLRQHATACADVSDGLISDCGHIANVSDVKFIIDTTLIPVSDPTIAWLKSGGCLQKLITAGDDYELVFTAPPQSESKLKDIAEVSGVKVTKMGYVEHGAGVICLDAEGEPMALTQTGYKHF